MNYKILPNFIRLLTVISITSSMVIPIYTYFTDRIIDVHYGVILLITTLLGILSTFSCLYLFIECLMNLGQIVSCLRLKELLYDGLGHPIHLLQLLEWQCRFLVVLINAKEQQVRIVFCF